ncbi:MAG: dTMP kinase [Vampirovibrionales bacterium]|nr:dTMP kinase [Vampirovibrionales bacterium]
METTGKHPAGLFITFEGIDGSGKSTQLALLAEKLRQADKTVIETRNPGGIPFGQQLREILLHSKGHVCPTSELLLFMADRAQHMQELVLPALAEGKIVLCDRHIDSSIAYQGYGRGLEIDEISHLNALAISGQKPHLTFLFDGDPALLAQRVNNRGEADRLEGESLGFYQRVRAGYLSIAKAEPQRFIVLDALETKESLLETLYAALEKQFELV